MASFTLKMLIVPLIMLDLLCRHTVAVHGQFYGGSMSYSMEQRNDGNYTVTVELISGWVLGKGPCGPGCSKSDIGRSTRLTRQLIKASHPYHFGNFTSDYQDSSTHRTIVEDMSAVVNSSYNETVIAVSEHSKWEQEMLHFRFIFSKTTEHLDLNFDGHFWRHLSLQEKAFDKGFSWHMQVSVSSDLRSDTGKPNRIPRSVIKPYYRVKLKEVTEIRIPVIDADEDFLRCELARFVEGGNIAVFPPPNVHVHDNCTVYINASVSSNYTDDTWIAVPVSVRDYSRVKIKYGLNTYLPGLFSLSSSPIQFVVQVLANLDVPEFVEPTVEGNHNFLLYRDTTWRTRIFAKAANNTTIDSFAAFGQHSENLTLSTLLQDTLRPQVKYTTLSWKPSSRDTASHIACVSALDNTGVESTEQRCFILHVRVANEIVEHLHIHRTSVDAEKGIAHLAEPVFVWNKPYFVDIPAPDQFVRCKVQTTCVLALYIKSSLDITRIRVTNSFVAYHQLGPVELVTHNGGQVYQTDISFEHPEHGKYRICFVASDKNGENSEEACIQTHIEPLDPCLSVPCQNSGDCKFDMNTGGYSCKCISGFSGKTCAIKIDPCDPDPCDPTGTGFCTGVSSMPCYCKPGYSGRICSENINDCLNDSCNGHGVCIDKLNGYDCGCYDRYNGTRCEYDKCPTQQSGILSCSKVIDLELCNPNPCGNGNCFHHKMQYTCVCPVEFTGRSCELELRIDPCMQSPCVRGTCFSHSSQYTCVCPPGFNGRLCEKLGPSSEGRQAVAYVQVQVGGFLSLKCDNSTTYSGTYREHWTKLNACGGYDEVSSLPFPIEVHATLANSGQYMCTFVDKNGTQIRRYFHVNVVSATQQDSCDFDDGSLCGWTQQYNDNFDWSLHNGRTQSGGMGPDNDHTLGTYRGKYLHIESSPSRTQGEYATLVSHVQPANQTKCFEFWYYLYGKGAGGLYVLLQDTCLQKEALIFKQLGDQGDHWNKASVTIPIQSIPHDYKIVIKAEVSATSQGDIAIDDLGLHKEQCQNAPVAPIIG